VKNKGFLHFLIPRLTLDPGSTNIKLMSVLFTISSEFHYQITRKLHEGGMGVVYEAEQHGARQFVKRLAIKVLRQTFTAQKPFIDNFIGEAKLVADLIHTNIVQTYHLGETQGIYYIAMELIRGLNLEELQGKLAELNRELPLELAVFITSRVARGLAYAHAKCDRNGVSLGIVHRDISFKNLLIAFEGDVKITDFGIAKARGLLLDQEGEIVAGKPEFMSPEQANFQITDLRSDLFSAGVVLASLLLGYNPFKGITSDESRDRILSMAIPNFCELNPKIEARLNEILQRALARNPQQRYSHADQLLFDLEHFIYHQGYGPTNETLGRFIRQIYLGGATRPLATDDTTACWNAYLSDKDKL
jgi:eukaryotic-like serine/threonine-protein kinase